MRKLSTLKAHAKTRSPFSSVDDAAAAHEHAKNEPDLSYLENLHSAIAILHLMVTCINTVLIPLAASHVTIRREMEKTTNLAMNRMEEKVNSILQHTIDVALSWVSKVLAGQKKGDFRPRDDTLGGGGSWLEQLQTTVTLHPLTISYPGSTANAKVHKLTDLPIHLHLS